jgi:predicted TIM-barrel fold metal-dependent hydrolase
MIYVGYVAENLKNKPSEYITSGRFFCSIETHEGPQMMNMFTDLLGDHILTYGTDYPHAESRFPDTVDMVMSWQNQGVPAAVLDKVLWQNPVAFFGEP